MQFVGRWSYASLSSPGSESWSSRPNSLQFYNCTPLTPNREPFRSLLTKKRWVVSEPCHDKLIHCLFNIICDLSIAFISLNTSFSVILFQFGQHLLLSDVVLVAFSCLQMGQCWLSTSRPTVFTESPYRWLQSGGIAAEVAHEILGLSVCLIIRGILNWLLLLVEMLDFVTEL